jgi:hypothetical protein
VWGVGRGADVCAGAEARVDEVADPVERGAVFVEVFGLCTDWGLPRKAEPRKVLIDRFNVLLARAGLVNVLDAEQEAATFGSA